MWKEMSDIVDSFKCFISDISCVSDNINLTPFLLVGTSFILRHSPESAPTLPVRHGATLPRNILWSNNSFVMSDQNRGARDLIISSFWGLALQHWVPCILTLKAKYLSLHRYLNRLRRNTNKAPPLSKWSWNKHPSRKALIHFGVIAEFHNQSLLINTNSHLIINF